MAKGLMFIFHYGISNAFSRFTFTWKLKADTTANAKYMSSYTLIYNSFVADHSFADKKCLVFVFACINTKRNFQWDGFKALRRNGSNHSSIFRVPPPGIITFPLCEAEAIAMRTIMCQLSKLWVNKSCPGYHGKVNTQICVKKNKG